MTKYKTQSPARVATLAVTLVGAFWAAGATSHAADGADKKPDPFGLNALQERFEANSPAVGERVPNTTVYNAQGETEGFRNLIKGKYAVVVFGCLT